MIMHLDDLALEAYLEHQCSGREQEEIERHLEVCSDCRCLVSDLSEIRRLAAALEAPPPPARAWRAVSRRIRVRSAWRTPSIRLAAAAAAVVLAAGGSLYLTAPRRSAPGGAADLVSVESELQAAEVHYQKAIDQLQEIAARDDGRLDPAAAAALDANLEAIDRAINESRAAIAARPDDVMAQRSLLEGFKSKLALLEDAVAAITESRVKG